MKFDGVRKSCEVKSYYFHYEPGDAMRYEFVLSIGTPEGDVLAMTCPKRGAMGLPDFWREGMDAGYIVEKLNLGHDKYTAGIVSKFLKQCARTPPETTQNVAEQFVTRLLKMYDSGRTPRQIMAEIITAMLAVDKVEIAAGSEAPFPATLLKRHWDAIAKACGLNT